MWCKMTIASSGYADGIASLVILEQARKHGVMIATAESCTGGMVSAAITDVAGSSAVFERSFVTYSNVAKTEMLGVRPATLDAVVPSVCLALAPDDALGEVLTRFGLRRVRDLLALPRRAALAADRDRDGLPDRLEAGTPNGVGIVGLGTAAGWIADHGVEEVHARQQRLAAIRHTGPRHGSGPDSRAAPEIGSGRGTAQGRAPPVLGRLPAGRHGKRRRRRRSARRAGRLG